MLIIYSLCLYLVTPLLVGFLWLRSLRAPEYRQRILERFGILPPGLDSGYIWLHSVSVGETVAVAPLARLLQKRYPGKRLLVTTMTPTGSDQVQRSFSGTVDHVYAPYDLPGSVRRFLDRTRPSICIIMETELWPNVLQQCDRRGIPTVLINARLSAGSAAGYARVAGIANLMMSKLDAVAVQHASDGQRFVDLGLAPGKLQITGSIKFDHDIAPEVREATTRLRHEWQGASKRPVWIAASTHLGEDEIILQAHQLLLDQGLAALLILVPRHPERFEDVYRLCDQAGMQVSRRSARQPVASDTQVVLGDTMGELAALYGACDIAFVGGSLVPRGGHNPIEPAAWGLPVLTGPHMFNFLDITEQLKERGGLKEVHNAEQIAAGVQSILTDSKAHAEAGAANHAVVEENRGATERQLAIIDGFLSG